MKVSTPSLVSFHVMLLSSVPLGPQLPLASTPAAGTVAVTPVPSYPALMVLPSAATPRTV